jgi:hypothetical protein
MEWGDLKKSERNQSKKVERHAQEVWEAARSSEIVTVLVVSGE